MVTQNELIENYKRDFNEKTGENIKVLVVSKWESLANFDKSPVNFWKVCKMVFDFTGWKKSNTFTKSRNAERVARRGLIDFLAVNNGCSLIGVGRATDRDHTTIIHSVNKFDIMLDSDMYTRKILIETMDFIRENYHFYKDKDIRPEDVQ